MGTQRGALQQREQFLDAVRTVAVLRVVVWHAFGATAITYVLSAVPAMFFVTGSLLARSIDHHGARATIVDRLRRILIPLAAFALVAFGVMALADRLAHSDNTALPRRAIAFWFVPILDPKGSAWEAGWLSSPLWYLRALVWILLAAPLLLRFVRRAPRATFVLLLSTIVVLDLATRHPAWPLQTTRAPWLVGDFALYATFVALGFLHRDGHLARLGRRAWLGVAAVAAAGAALWVLTQPVPDGVVNNSHPMHLLVGFAWLAVALASQPAIERLAARPRAGAFIAAMNARSMSVYLWHSAAIIVGYQLLWRIPLALPRGVFSALLVSLTIIGTLTLVTAFGWIEDVAARRRRLLWPAQVARYRRESSAIALAGVSVFALVGLGGVTLAPLDTMQQARAASLPAPSRQPATPMLVSEAPTPEEDGKILLAASVKKTNTAIDDQVASVVRAWLAAHDVDGAQVAIMSNGSLVHIGAYGSTGDDRALLVTDTFDTWSITKTYTAWLTYQLVQAGTLSLDAPLPTIAKLPALDTSRISVRTLLDHSTGLTPYRDAAIYTANPTAIQTAVDAMRAVLAQPLRFTPGSKHEYSSSNYLVLGLVIEQVTGRSYDDLLQHEILDPLALTATTHAAATPGNPNFSTGGIVTTIGDLAVWAQSYLADHRGIDAPNVAAMTSIDPASAMGAGVIGYCPCTSTPSGVGFAAVGYNGATTQIQYAASDGTLVAVNLTQSLWEPASRYQDVGDLFASLRRIVGPRDATS